MFHCALVNEAGNVLMGIVLTDTLNSIWISNEKSIFKIISSMLSKQAFSCIYFLFNMRLVCAKNQLHTFDTQIMQIVGTTAYFSFFVRSKMKAKTMQIGLENLMLSNAAFSSI